MAEWQSRWMHWEPSGNQTTKTTKRSPRATSGGFGGSTRRARRETTRELDAGEIEAVRLTGTVIGEVWLARDAEAAVSIQGAGVPVFYFEEVERLRGKRPEELRAIAATKRAFPGSRIVQ